MQNYPKKKLVRSNESGQFGAALSGWSFAFLDKKNEKNDGKGNRINCYRSKSDQNQYVFFVLFKFTLHLSVQTARLESESHANPHHFRN